MFTYYDHVSSLILLSCMSAIIVWNFLEFVQFDFWVSDVRTIWRYGDKDSKFMDWNNLRM